MVANQTRASNLQIYMINARFLLPMTNEDGLHTMVKNERQARELHMVRKRRE